MVLLALLAGCVVPDPFVPPEVDPPNDPGPECSIWNSHGDNYVPGFPDHVFIRLSLPSEWCLYLPDVYFSDWDGQWFVQRFDSDFADWELIEQAVVYVADRPIAWFYDGELGFDPHYDLWPHRFEGAEDYTDPSGFHWSTLCVETQIEFEGWTPLRRINIDYTTQYRFCEAQ